jgi:hypothetical protein
MLLLGLMINAGWSPALFAQAASESTTTIEDVTKDAPKSGSDIDETITNAKMRAETGSKSTYSLSSQLSYIGGSVKAPLAMERPNIAAANGTTDAALLGGQISAKYNVSAAASWQAGIGVRWISPLQGSKMPDAYDGQKVDADNPYLTYQYLYKWSDIQSALQVTPTAYTQSNLVRDGYVTSLGISQNNIYEVGKTGLSLGLYLLVQGGVFNNNSPEAKAKQSDYLVNFDPFIEYQFSDRLNFRTVTNLWNYEHARSAAANTYIFDKVYQSVGVGISVTRDIFLYPNLQFLPDNIRADQTNVALNTYINL